MAWAYCSACERELPEPSFADAVLGVRECPFCGSEEELIDHERRSVIDGFVDAVTSGEIAS